MGSPIHDLNNNKVNPLKRDLLELAEFLYSRYEFQKNDLNIPKNEIILDIEESSENLL